MEYFSFFLSFPLFKSRTFDSLVAGDISAGD